MSAIGGAVPGPAPRLRGIRLVLFDLAGTTVVERQGGGSLVDDAFVAAFGRVGVVLPPGAVRPHRGREKLAAIRSLLAEHGPGVPAAGSGGTGSTSAEAVHEAFREELARGMDRFREVSGVRETFRFLRARDVRIGVGSGFPPETMEALLTSVGWVRDGLVDYRASAVTLGAGRPDPAMIRDAMARLGVEDPRAVLKVGDTVVDMEEGRNGGARTVGVLTGAHGESELRRAGADFVLPSVAEVPALFG